MAWGSNALTESATTLISQDNMLCKQFDCDIRLTIPQNIFNKLYNRVVVDIRPEYRCSALQTLLRQESFKLAYKFFARQSWIGQELCVNVANSNFLAQDKYLKPSGELYIYGPDAVIHLPKDKFSTGGFHMDSAGNHDPRDLDVLWVPLFEITHIPLSAQHATLTEPIRIENGKMLLFSAMLEHKGNYNYSDRFHCALIFRLSRRLGIFGGTHIKIKNGNVVYSSMQASRITINDLTKIAEHTFCLLEKLTQEEALSSDFEHFSENVPFFSDCKEWYCAQLQYFLRKVVLDLGFSVKAIDSYVSILTQRIKN